MSAYAIAHLRPIEEPGEDVFTYIERIQATLDPFDGHFLVHGGQLEELEGSWPGYVVVIAFPDRAAVRDWYESAAYQEILPLRTRHIEGEAIIADGVAPGYDPAHLAAGMRAAAKAAAGAEASAGAEA
ncbi:DUF1330 domain-containing protein [Streptomyces sp. NPDC050844]|uniref:DUF1330 domain-containing protein n=1 Tax=Streptomyces sp. NPDC050844 TaxID=3155790 RepID=UPI0033F1560C